MSTTVRIFILTTDRSYHRTANPRRYEAPRRAKCVARHAKAFGPRRPARPGQHGLFDIVRCEYAAPPFVIASHDAAGCDRARTKPRDAAKATARLVTCRLASRGCARVLVSACSLLV